MVDGPVMASDIYALVFSITSRRLKVGVLKEWSILLVTANSLQFVCILLSTVIKSQFRQILVALIF